MRFQVLAAEVELRCNDRFMSEAVHWHFLEEAVDTRGGQPLPPRFAA